MDASSTYGSPWTKALMLVLTGSELTGILYDARWLLLLIALCVAADFRYGWGESRKRYGEAKAAGDAAAMEKYRWHKSRAIRRTLNKLTDYVVWVAVGVTVGNALLDPMGLPRVYGGVAAAAVVVLCEGISFTGHFLYLRGIELQSRTVGGFLKGLVIGFAKSRDPDIGQGIEEGLREAAQEAKPRRKKRGT